MKTITFFSEKGGVGKSSISIMYASWLKHKWGVSVAVADFNNRISFYRECEIEERNKFINENPETNVQPFDTKKSWPIITVYQDEIDDYVNEGRKLPYATWFQNEYLKGRLKGYDVVLCDFPGNLTGNEFLNLASLRLLNLIVIPTERDQMAINSTLRLNDILSNGKQNYCCFINKAQLGLKNFRGQYMKLGKKLTEKGIPMLPDIITYSDRMMTIDKVDIIRSTFGFPEFGKGKYKNLNDLGTENLFIDVTRELKRTRDLDGTVPADLSFIENVKKTDNGKMFKDSAFPEYEIII